MQTRAGLTHAAVLVPSALRPRLPFGRSILATSCGTLGGLLLSSPGAPRRPDGPRLGVPLILTIFHDLLGGAGLPRPAGPVRLATVRARRSGRRAGGSPAASRPALGRLRRRRVAPRPGPVDLAADVLDAVVHPQPLPRHPDLAAVRLRAVVPGRPRRRGRGLPPPRSAARRAVDAAAADPVPLYRALVLQPVVDAQPVLRHPGLGARRAVVSNRIRVRVPAAPAGPGPLRCRPRPALRPLPLAAVPRGRLVLSSARGRGRVLDADALGQVDLAAVLHTEVHGEALSVQVRLVADRAVVP